MRKFMVVKYNGNIPLDIWDNLSQKAAIELAEKEVKLMDIAEE